MKTASIDWKEDFDCSGGLRERRQEIRRGRESMQGHVRQHYTRTHADTHMYTQTMYAETFDTNTTALPRKLCQLQITKEIPKDVAAVMRPAESEQKTD